jgi:hypothetical protein
MRNLYRYLKSGIGNLVYWFPIIWQDKDWDHYYLLAILRHKMNSMVKFYDGPHAWGIDSPIRAHEMKVCRLILDRLIEDDYNREGYDAHDEKWGELEFTTDDKTGLLTITRGNRNMNEELEQKEYKGVYEKEEELRKTDIDNLFEIIRKNIQKWWD